LGRIAVEELTGVARATRVAGKRMMIGVRIIDPPVDDLRSDDPNHPAFEVTFWSRLTEPAEIPEHERGWMESIAQIADADVKEVIAWADENVGEGRTYQIKVAVASRDDGLNLVWLYGTNPAAGDTVQ
jgi:hypothetical protein